MEVRAPLARKAVKNAAGRPPISPCQGSRGAGRHGGGLLRPDRVHRGNTPVASRAVRPLPNPQFGGYPAVVVTELAAHRGHLGCKTTRPRHRDAARTVNRRLQARIVCGFCRTGAAFSPGIARARSTLPTLKAQGETRDDQGIPAAMPANVSRKARAGGWRAWGDRHMTQRKHSEGEQDV